MTETAIKKALSRREALIRSIEILEQRLSTAKTELENANRFIGAWVDFASEDELKELGPALDAVSAASEKPLSNPSKEKVASEAASIIRHLRRPLRRTELFQALERAGVRIYGKNPEMVLSTMLWRMRKKIVRLEKYGYWVADEPFPPAGYDPHRPYHHEMSPEAEDVPE